MHADITYLTLFLFVFVDTWTGVYGDLVSYIFKAFLELETF